MKIYEVDELIYTISLWPALVKIKENFNLDGTFTATVPVATYIYGSTPPVETEVCNRLFGNQPLVIQGEEA